MTGVKISERPRSGSSVSASLRAAAIYRKRLRQLQCEVAAPLFWRGGRRFFTHAFIMHTFRRAALPSHMRDERCEARASQSAAAQDFFGCLQFIRDACGEQVKATRSDGPDFRITNCRRSKI